MCVLQTVVQHAHPDSRAVIAQFVHGKDVQAQVGQVGAGPGVLLKWFLIRKWW
jgi:hypothetical protein